VQIAVFRLAILHVCVVASLSGIFFGCAHKVTLRSEPPGASVRAVDEEGRATLLPGATPLKLDGQGGSEVRVFEFRKEGFLPVQVIVAPPAGAQTDVAVTLQPLSRSYLAETARRDFPRSLNDNLGKIFKLQTLVVAKDKEGVAKLEASMRAEWNEVSLFHSLMGNHLYLQGDRKAARARYEKALSLDPENEEALAMLRRLK
jgi:hypothetical protein